MTNKGMNQQQTFSGKISWRSPSNIALIKYWGKKASQIPASPSISMTLSKSFTQCTVSYDFHSARLRSEVKLFFNHQPAPENFAIKTTDFIRTLETVFPFLCHFRLTVHTFNSFPHSAGIASSASSMSALALCIATILSRSGQLPADSDFFRTASFMARLGSGSAARSVYGGYSLWGKTPLVENTSDEYAVPLNDFIHPVFREYGDAILVVSSGTKEISSSAGHAMMQNHSYSEGRIRQAGERLERLLQVLKEGKEQKFTDIVENEALTLHALMMSSEPAFFLLQPETIAILKKIKSFRAHTNLPVTFTIDAGPNVHLLYPLRYRKEITGFIASELEPYCENRQWIDDGIGSGPEQLIDEV
ncbi:MAG: diphosphomevalonate/mevalonate 3,5-bisphosphate decarboxylase family protein [Bacteroidales bacterium]